MIKILVIVALGLVLVGLTVFAYNGQTNPTHVNSAQDISREFSEDIVYGHLFRHIAAFTARAEEIERQGKDARHLRNYFKRKADLSEVHWQTLERIAVECVREIEAIDEEAKPVINAYKAQYPNGHVSDGQPPAPPPDELRSLTKKRKALILHKRDEIQAAFGEEAFQDFREFVRTRISPNVRPVSTLQ